MVDIAGVINKMRHQRMMMVQTVVSTGYECVVSVLFSYSIVYFRNSTSSSMMPFWSQWRVETLRYAQ